MGFKITLHIKHIAGWTFDIECERDADALGIKVLIWTIQHIPVAAQRLVFGGREMDDSTKLSDLGIKDDDMLFLVETKQEVEAEEQQEIRSSTNVTTIPITSTYIEPQIIELQQQQPAPLHVSIPAPDVEYSYLDADSAKENEWKIRSVTKLSCWIRAYLWLGTILTLVATIKCCYFSAIPFFFYLMGIIGTRRLSRCLLLFPVILTMTVGIGGVVLNIMYWMNSWWQIVPIMLAIMHIAIFLCITKLICKISTLNHTEYRQARVRISSRCCCC